MSLTVIYESDHYGVSGKKPEIRGSIVFCPDCGTDLCFKSENASSVVKCFNFVCLKCGSGYSNTFSSFNNGVTVNEDWMRYPKNLLQRCTEAKIPHPF